MKVWISVVLVAFFAYIYDKTVLPYKFQLKHFERISQCGVSSLVTDTIPRHAYRSFEAELPQLSTQEKRIRRQEDVKTAKELYRFVEEEPFVGFPPYIAKFDTLKCEEDFGVWDQIDFVGDKDRGRMGQLYAYLFLDGNLTTIEARDGFFRSKFFERPPIADHWTEDTEFSYQRLAGVNPFKLHRIFELPSNFAITPGRIEKFLDAGKKFEDELKEGKFYFEDHSMLDGVPVVNGTILPAPLILHYSSIQGLKPVAIQILPQAESSPMGVLYPDEGYAWLFAKITAQHANAIDHQVVAHLLKTHLYAEVFAIAMHRALHHTHPLYVLLHPHFIKTLSINHEARIFLIPVVIKDCAATAVSGTVEVGKRAFQADHFENLNLKKDLIKRGVWDPNFPADKQPLLGYDYRDFGLPVYNIIEKYVRNVLRVFYKDDESVRLDSELQDFCYEARINGKFPGFPEKVETFEDLVDVITSIIWTCSGRHSSANFNQYEMLGWVPNMPLSVQLNEWPQSKSEITNITIVNMLPSYFRSFLQILSVKVLSKHPWNPFLHMVHPSSWQNLEAQSIRDQYVADLYKISAEFKRINDGRSDLRKYLVLDPLTMPLSIGI